jgi:hypothetical protein
MLSRERIDLLSVATPDDRHAQIVVDAAESGVKGMLCEKPISSLAHLRPRIAHGDRPHSRFWRG